MSFTTRPELRGTFGMVASTHWLASGVGMSVLERGGNAFDAAVAAGFVLQVVEPHLNGPGGDVPVIFSSGGEVRVLCGQGPAPAAATIDAYTARGLDLVPGVGPLAAVVPGAFDAWALMLRDFGTWELADVMAPAIAYARDGYPVVPGIVAGIRGAEELFRDEWPSSAEVYLPAPEAGRLFRNVKLADAYGRLAQSPAGSREARIDAARDAFYRGWVAEAVDEFFAAEDGLLTGEDMAGWTATLEAPVTLDYHGHTICKTGPWGQGPVMLQQLALLAGFDLAAMAPGELVHTVIECAKLAFADREAWYGDPDFVDVPLAALLSAAYADERRALVGAEASTELRPGSPGGLDPQLPPLAGGRAAAAAGSGEPTLGLAGDTCHLDVADRHGNLVSATPSGGWLHGSPIVPGLGFCMGTRAQMFWLTEGLPNSLEPGKRPRTTLTPTLVLREGEPYMAIGTPGGDMQDQWQLGALLGHLVLGRNLQEAIDAPSFHSNHMPSSFHPRDMHLNELEIEERAGSETIDELRRRGHDVQVRPPWSLGRVSAVAREPDGLLKAGANPRGMQGYAVGR
jgi:gamma-glutamyltranspeptidase/glutathione hydrolase